MQTLSPMLLQFSTMAAGSLVSAVWKGAVIVACVALCLRLMPGVRASARSLVWMVVFLMLVGLPFASGFHRSVEGGVSLHFDVRWAWGLGGVWLVLSLVRLGQLVRSAVHLRGIAKRARVIEVPAELVGLGIGGQRFQAVPEDYATAGESQFGDLSAAHDMKPSCFGRDDRVCEGAKESGRPFGFAQGRYPPFAKSAKGRAPRVVADWAKNGWGEGRLFGRRVVRLCASDEVSVPSVVGFFKPLILLPPELLTKLSTGDLQRIVLHEMEHLRRGDDWTNLLQKVSLVLFPVNPVLLWVERRLCVERELACDDGVLRATGARKAYATCLANLAEQSLIRRGALLALGAWERQSELARRVSRILRAPVGEMGRVQTVAMVAVMIAGTAGGVMALERTPQLVSFSNASVVTTAAMKSVAVGPALQAAETPHVELVKAVMPRRRVAVTVRAEKAARVAPIPDAVDERQVRRGQSEEMLIGWKRDAAGGYRPVAVTFAQDSQFTYAAIAVQDGWLIVQL
jgi:hypothetical protein